MARHLYECATCGRSWPSPLYAIDCAEQDAIEIADDNRDIEAAVRAERNHP